VIGRWIFNSTQLDELYNEKCRVAGDLVFILHDHGEESKQIVIADALRAALAQKHPERPEILIKAMKAALGLLDK